MRVANHEKGIWIYKTRNKNMICAEDQVYGFNLLRVDKIQLKIHE